jgi:hypothetical protein
LADGSAQRAAFSACLTVLSTQTHGWLETNSSWTPVRRTYSLLPLPAPENPNR